MRTYYTHTLPTGEPMNYPHVGVKLFLTTREAKAYYKNAPVKAIAIIDPADLARLRGIEAAAKNAMDNSWVIEEFACNCEAEDWGGCTVLDPADAAELRTALAREGK